VSKNKIKLELKMFLPNINCTQAAERAEKCRFYTWWPWSLTVDLDIQTHLSEGRNTSSLWIWRKSVRRFPWYFIRKKSQTAPKTEPYAVHCVR